MAGCLKENYLQEILKIKMFGTCFIQSTYVATACWHVVICSDSIFERLLTRAGAYKKCMLKMCGHTQLPLQIISPVPGAI